MPTTALIFTKFEVNTSMAGPARPVRSMQSDFHISGENTLPPLSLINFENSSSLQAKEIHVCTPDGACINVLG